VVVGERPARIADGAREAGLDADRIFEVDDAEAAHDVLRPRLVPGDVILVKASRGIELDRLVATLRRELEP
jgi:UDP-N-acetylmuramoyl-tripeptide--D-alanyl-D-alanine ligase